MMNYLCLAFNPPRRQRNTGTEDKGEVLCLPSGKPMLGILLAN